MTHNAKDSGKDFLKSDKSKSGSIAIDIPSVALPNGGGAIKGIDEKFSVNAINGTASFSIPLPFSESRVKPPSLSLVHNSGSGNDVFGLGWSLNLQYIQRKTDQQIPQYLDAEDSDVFLFLGGEDLVPAFKKSEEGNFQVDENGDYIINEIDSIDQLFLIRFYIPRIEGLYARIERWTEKSTGRIKWKVTTKENSTTLFGWTDNSVISNPADPSKIYKWFPEFVVDDKGNSTQYIYKKENEIGFNPDLIHHKNRYKNNAITYTNLYIDKILYGNKTPYQLGQAFPIETDYMFQTVFDYGTVLPNQSPDIMNEWDFRPDAFSNYKAGFEIRTTRLCKRVLLFHVFDELALNEDKSDRKTLINSLDFEYDISSEQDFMLLESITSRGFIKKVDGSYSAKELPPMQFEYQKHEWNDEIKTISSESVVHLPAGVDAERYQFADLFNEGLSGLLTEQANGWYYKHNLGDGKFEHAKLVKEKPSFVGLGTSLQLLDLDADGGKQLVSYNQENPGYFELGDNNKWQSFRSFNALPNLDLKDANTRMLDLNGDGKPDVVITEDNVFKWYASDGRKGFYQARQSSKHHNEEEGPNMLFSEPTQSVFLADMSGDGMKDIVRVRNGEICYWSNLGYGNFGAKTVMGNAPHFDFQDSFNPAYLKLVDIDGSGTTDLVYLGKNSFTCWKNQSGNQFGKESFEIRAFPEIHSETQLTIADLLGNGLACIVWSSSLSKDQNTPLKYIDLMGGKKPYIMTSYKNNLGKEVSFEYTPSTKFYIQDKLAGKPWVTKLHFPIHCISKIITEDKISGHKFTSEYNYHHGYFDHHDREFRGFGMVEQIDAESVEHWVKGQAANIVEEPMHQEPVVNRTWHHTGAFLGKDRILDQFKADYWHAEMERKGFSTNHCEVELPDAQLIAAAGVNSALINRLSSQDWRDALRACKGIGIRTEIFAKDAIKNGSTIDALKKELIPFSVSTRNCTIELLQPKGKNKHAVFVVNESETIDYGYERNTEDPRISHNLKIKSDEFGNVLESASIVYPRMNVDSALPKETQEAQRKTIIIYSDNKFTNDVLQPNAYRLRVLSEAKTYELKGVPKLDSYYKALDFDKILEDANSELVFYHQKDKPLTNGKAQRRLIEQTRSMYYRNDLSGPLPIHQLESLGLPFEHYQLAYSPELIADIFGTKVNSGLLSEGKFTNFEGDNNWWVRSGVKRFIDGDETAVDAQNRFFVPIAYENPYGSATKVAYYGDYFLNIKSTEDSLGNITVVDRYNFRTLSTQRLRDINGNYSEVIENELGMVKAMALMGKGNEADELTELKEETDGEENKLIQDFFNAPDSIQVTATAKNLLKRASTYFVYDFEAYINTGKPAVSVSIARETHYRKPNGTLNPESNVQIAFEYSNGMEEVVMKKVQAPPGEANEVVVNNNDTVVIHKINTALSVPQQLRWIGTGRVIKNNKGKPVKEYEPYFSVNPTYEDVKELVQKGVTAKLFYDALGRLIKKEMPNGTCSKREFDSWKQTEYDVNDTIIESAWYVNRTGRLIDNELIAEGKDPGREKLAADKAAKHANTPNVLHFDTLGRPILSIEHNKNGSTNADEFYHTKLKLDAEGNLQTVTDPRNNDLMHYKYDMLGNQVYHSNMDAGQRWLFANVEGNPLRKWDERDHEFHYFYDQSNRITHSKIVGGDGVAPLDHIFDKTIYGENLLLPDRSNEPTLRAKNVLGKVVENYDTAGRIETPKYDLKGEPVETIRKLFRKYKEVANWTAANLTTDLEEDEFIVTIERDAFGRIIKQITPDKSEIHTKYNAAGLLSSEAVLAFGAIEPEWLIKNIDYNEKGQKKAITYGNNVRTKFHYDRETFRLQRLDSKRQNGDPLQDLYYTFDPVGNITHIEDKNIPVTFFDNQKITGISEYTYDSLYRLVQAKGRENNAVLDFGACDNWNDKPFMVEKNWGDPMAVRNYAQSYEYDSAGNLKKMKHLAAGGNWTRNYDYETLNNRLISTQIGDINNPCNYIKYAHHEKHGYLLELPHLEKIVWNFKEELVLTTRQHCTADNIPIITYYQYDGNGQRIRKITENQAIAEAEPTKKEERIYINGYELYKKHSGLHAGLERVSISLTDQKYRFAIIETRNDINDNTEKRLVRYQLYNHLGSSALELDGTAAARVISYEEYHPYGTTAYQANNKSVKSAAKRYRYTSMERDEETGLEYHGARYYIPWLGRWLSSDPLFKENQPVNPTANTDNPTGQNSLNDDQVKATSIEKPPNEDPAQNANDGAVGERSNESEQKKNPIISLVSDRPYSERLTDLKNMNLYSYGAQNPVIYIDPTGNAAIIQAWWGAYDKSSGGEAFGWGVLFIFAWLAHVIVNLFILAVSVTLLNPGGLFGALDFTWGAPQSILGLALGIFTILLGADVRPHNGIAVEIEMPAYMKFYKGYGVSLGPFTFGGNGFSHWNHEAGHTWQSRLLGPLYLFIIGIPSAAGAKYTEKWADSWAM